MSHSYQISSRTHVGSIIADHSFAFRVMLETPVEAVRPVEPIDESTPKVSFFNQRASPLFFGSAHNQ